MAGPPRGPQRHGRGPLARPAPGHGRAVRRRPTVRVVVVAAKGPHFSVGLDLKAMGGMLTGGGGERRAATPRPSIGGPGPQRRGPRSHPAPAGRHHGGGATAPSR